MTARQAGRERRGSGGITGAEVTPPFAAAEQPVDRLDQIAGRDLFLARPLLAPLGVVGDAGRELLAEREVLDLDDAARLLVARPG